MIPASVPFALPGVRRDLVQREETAMTLAINRGPSDRKQVNISNPSELRAWAQHFRVSAKALILAVTAVGSGPDEVADYLGV